MANCLHKEERVANRLKDSDLVPDSTQEICQFEFDIIFITFIICGRFVVKLFWVVTKTIHGFVFLELLFLVQITISRLMEIFVLQY